MHFATWKFFEGIFQNSLEQTLEHVFKKYLKVFLKIEPGDPLGTLYNFQIKN